MLLEVQRVGSNDDLQCKHLMWSLENGTENTRQFNFQSRPKESIAKSWPDIGEGEKY